MKKVFNPYVQIMPKDESVNHVIKSLSDKEFQVFMSDMHDLIAQMSKDDLCKKREDYVRNHFTAQHIEGRYFISDLNIALFFDLHKSSRLRNIPKGDYAIIEFEYLKEVGIKEYNQRLKEIKAKEVMGYGDYGTNRN